MATHRDIFTPLPEALSLIHARRKDKKLLAAIKTFLQNDIPPHFDQVDPILYLCRHIATPNYEAMRFIEIGKPHQLPLVISEDSKGIFFSNNVLKRSLGKLPVVKGIARNRDEIIENFTVIDFKNAEGKPFNEISTHWNRSLIDLHHNLFSHIYETGVTLVDEANWIDQHHRENLLEQYKHLLTLLIAHGIMFESYSPDESRLVEKVLFPAFEFITKEFGHKPLIFELIDEQQEGTRDWNAYPSVLYRPLKDIFKS